MTHASLLKRQIYRFLIVGGVATLIDMIVYSLFVYYAIFNPSVSKRLSFGIGSIWSYFMHKHYTFEQKSSSSKAPLLFITVYAIGFLINSLGHDFILSLTSFKPLAYVVGTGLSTCSNFVLQKTVVFKKKLK